MPFIKKIQSQNAPFYCKTSNPSQYFTFNCLGQAYSVFVLRINKTYVDGRYTLHNGILMIQTIKAAYCNIAALAGGVACACIYYLARAQQKVQN